jgi:hypothetical protein
MNAHALEATATQAQNNNAAVDMRVDAKDAVLTAVINQMLSCSKQGKDFVSDPSVPGRDANGCVARSAPGSLCTTANKIYDPTDSAADGDGCVYGTIVPTPVSQPEAIMSFPGSSYFQLTGNYYITPTQTRDFTNYVSDGAPSFTVNFTTSGFVPAAGCEGPKTVTIPSMGLDASGNFDCWYDHSPNRRAWIYWAYVAASKHFNVYMEWYQDSHPNVTLTNMNVQYTANRLKFGNE